MYRNYETERRIKLLFPEHTRICFSSRSTFPVSLFPEELVGTERMVRGRFHEFSHGRACAHTVLKLLGMRASGIPVGENRAPIWPEGIVGSISHSGAAAAAVAAKSSKLVGIGLDIESSDSLSDELISIICRVDENVGDDGERAKLLFSIKEAIYKCIFPSVGSFVDFLEVKVCFDTNGRSFTARTDSVREDLHILQRLEGAYCINNGLVLSAAWLPPSSRVETLSGSL